MSQQQSFGSSGSSPESGIQSLTPDTGAVVTGSSVSVVGMPSYTTQVIETSNVGGELQIENRALMTPYVVNANATPGQRGTYTNIQDAIDAAVADGCDILSRKCGFIYCIGELEGFDIPERAYIYIKGVSNSGQNSFLYSGTTVTTLCTIGDNTIVDIEDITFINTSGPCLLCDNTPANLSINQCTFSSSSGYSFEYIGGSSSLKISNSYFLTQVRFSAPGFTSPAYIYNSIFQGSILMDQAMSAEFSYCTLNLNLELNALAYFDMFDCDSDVQFLVYGTSTTAVSPCRVNNLWIPTPSSAPIFNFPGTVLLGSVYYQSPTLGTSRELGNGTGTIIAAQQLKGNITTAQTVIADYSAQNYDTFIWCNHELPITIQLSPGAANNQEITIKDMTFGASTNNITITVSDGLIEGAASLVMNQNGQCVRLKKLGTDYYLI